MKGRSGRKLEEQDKNTRKWRKSERTLGEKSESGRKVKKKQEKVTEMVKRNGEE